MPGSERSHQWWHDFPSKSEMHPMQRIWVSTRFRISRSFIVIPLKAIVWSLAVVGVSAGFVGVIFELVVVSEWSDENSIVQCASTGEHGRVVILSRTVLGGGQPTRYRLWSCDSTNASRPVTLPWTSSKPSCVACVPGTDRIAVGGWDGAIHLAEGTDLSQPPHLLGRHADGAMISIECGRRQVFGVADGWYATGLGPGVA